MPTVTLPRNSLFRSTPFYQVGDDLLFGLLKQPILPDPTDGIYEVVQGTENRLDLIADAAYQDRSLWWVIACANRIADIQFGVKLGMRLRIPTASRVANITA